MSRYAKLTRLAVIGLSVSALLPATAAAMPINDGPATAQHLVGPGVTPSTPIAASRHFRGGGDVVSGHGYHLTVTPSTLVGDVVSGHGYHFKAMPAGSGIDRGVLIVLAVGIVLALIAWFLLVAGRPRTRERQAA